MVARIEWEVRKRMKEGGEIENGERKKMLKRIYVLAIGIVLFSVFVMPVTATGEMTATRDISIQTVKPGDTFTVTVTIVANKEVEAPALDEDLPEGWEVISVENDGGIFKESTVEWIWTEKLSAGDSKTVIYNVTVPLDAETGTYYINGHVSAYGVNPIAVGGESEVIVRRENKLPIASFTYSPENPVVDQNITFDASSSYDPDGTIVKYEWDFGDGSKAEGKVVTHAYSKPGEYVVTLTVTDDGGARNSTSIVVAVSEAFDPTKWKYRKEITIKENSGRNLTDYQVLIELNSTNFEFSKAKPDGSDIRFTDESGKKLPYWIEEWSDNEAKIWIKVPFIPANGETRIYMYYGNPDAISESNGDAVFEFFDDFSEPSLNTEKWVVFSQGGEVKVENGVCKIIAPEPAERGSHAVISSTLKFDINSMFTVRRMKVTTGSDWRGPMLDQGFSETRSGSGKNYVRHHTEFHRETWVSWDLCKEGNRYCPYRDWSDVDVSEGEWYVSGVAWYESNGVRRIAWFKNHVHDRNMDYSSNDYVPHKPMYVFLKAGSYWDEYDNTGYMAVDWAYVRKFTYPEPTVIVQKETPTTEAKIVFFDGFNSLENWTLVVYNSAGGSENDPAPTLDYRKGLPPPSLDPNGDSWCGNGAYTKKLFDYTEGLTIEFDMYVASGYGWNWGWVGLADHRPNLNNPRDDGAYIDPLRCDPCFVAGVKFDGTEWNTKLWFEVRGEDGKTHSYAVGDPTGLLNKWNAYKINIRPDGRVEFYVNEGLIWTSPKINASFSPAPLLVGSRDATGPVRIDNVRVSKMTPTPSISTVSFNPPEIKIPLGSMSAIDLTLDVAPNGLSGYNISISLSDSLSDGSVAEITSVEFPTWVSLHSNSTLPADSLWIKAADLKDEIKSGAKNITLATITLRGDKQGKCDILVTVTKMDDDNGNPIDPNTVSGKIEVVGVIPFPGCENPPTDPDRDGLYEDINGNGRKDFNDVVVFFNYLEWVERNQPCIECFDFNKNGRIDFDDVVKLFEEI